MNNIFILTSIATTMFIQQVKAIEIVDTDITSSANRNIQVEKMVVKASAASKQVTPNRVETNIQNHNLQNERVYEPIDCFGKLNNSRSN